MALLDESLMNLNLTDKTFIILRKRNFLELTFQEFRAHYANTFNVVNAPERAKLMKLAIIKVSYSQKHKKQTMRVLIEQDYLCEHSTNCTNLDCQKLHVLRTSDRCPSFDRDQQCNQSQCTKLHIPSKSLRARIVEVFKKSARSIMPFSKFIVLHRTTYPFLREHHPTNDILTTDEFADLVRIENTDKTKEIRLLRKRRSGDKYSGIERPPCLSENIDAPHPALKIISFDTLWIDSETLIKDILTLFSMKRVKDIFIPGHMRMAFVTFDSVLNAQYAVRKLNGTWFCGRKVTVSLAERRSSLCENNINNNNDEEKVPSTSSRVCIKAINNVISESRIKEWLIKIGEIVMIESRFVPCRKGSDVAYVHFKSTKTIHEILNKEKKNNYVITFRGKHVKLGLCDDGYTDSSAYYSLKTKQNQSNQSASDTDLISAAALQLNGNSPRVLSLTKEAKNDEQKQKQALPLTRLQQSASAPAASRVMPLQMPAFKARAMAMYDRDVPPPSSHRVMLEQMQLQAHHAQPHAQAHTQVHAEVAASEHHKNDKNDSMQLLVMRLKSLIENTIEMYRHLDVKLHVLSLVNVSLTLDHSAPPPINGGDEDEKQPVVDVDVDVDEVFGDETYTIDALKESLDTLKNDKHQIQVYKQALTAFETSQSRAINKTQRQLAPVADKEIELAQSLQSVKADIEALEKQLALKRNEQQSIKLELDRTRGQTKTLRREIDEMKSKIGPIRHCLAAFQSHKPHNGHGHGHGQKQRSHSAIIGASKPASSSMSIKADEIPSAQQIEAMEANMLTQETHINHWLRWDAWNLQDATTWIGSLGDGKFVPHLAKFNALSKISQGSILNAITDPTLQLIGIESAGDRKCIIDNIALLKSRTAMMKNSRRKFKTPKLRNVHSQPHARRGSLSQPSLLNQFLDRKNKQYGKDDMAVQEMMRATSIQSDASDANLCVICMDRQIAPYAMVPCGHQCLCSICKNLIKPSKHKCPMCNGPVSMIIKLFRA